MNINYKQAQFELFPGSPGSSADTGRPRYLFANLNLSMENMVILGIIILMGMVFIFSLGVEKGKKLVGQSHQMNISSLISPTSASGRASTGSIHGTVSTAVPLNTVNGVNGNLLSKDKNSLANVNNIRDAQNPNSTVKVSNPQIRSSSGMKTTENILPDKNTDKAQTVFLANSNVSALKNSSSVLAKKDDSSLGLSANKPYTIQVASYKDDQYAQKEANSLKKKKFDAFVITKGDFIIVCVGKFSKKEDANGILSKMKKNYNDCLIRRL